MCLQGETNMTTVIALFLLHEVFKAIWVRRECGFVKDFREEAAFSLPQSPSAVNTDSSQLNVQTQ